MLALGTCLPGLGCEPEPVREDRFARRFIPFEAKWRRESQIPKRPQKKPVMVIWEVSRFAPGSIPSPEQEAAAKDLIERSHAAAQAHGWDDFEKGLADSYYLAPDDELHYANDEFLLDDAILDPERPEFLMYYPTKDGMALAGFMFFVRERMERGPQIGGPLTVWHYHIFSRRRCYRDDIISIGMVWDLKHCKQASHKSPEMLHIWLVDHPGGPFATSMFLDPSLLPALLEKRMRERGY